jgi:hypothetical protein
VGTSVYFSGINGMTATFIERFFGYRHVTNAIAGKPFVLAVGGAMMIDPAIEQFKTYLSHFEVDVREVATFQSRVPPCFKCGRHKECSIGGLYMMLGDAAHELTITPEMFGQWEDDETATEAIKKAADALKNL